MFKTIGWATDGSESADRALPFAKALAQGDDRALVAVHAKELLQGQRPLHAGEHEIETKIRRHTFADAARTHALKVVLTAVPAGGKPAREEVLGGAA